MVNHKYTTRKEYEIEQYELNEFFITKEELQLVLIKIKRIKKKLNIIE